MPPAPNPPPRRTSAASVVRNYLLQTGAQLAKDWKLISRRKGTTASHLCLLGVMMVLMWGMDTGISSSNDFHEGGTALDLHPCLEAVDVYDRVHATTECAVLAYSAPTPAALEFAAGVMAR